MTFVEPVRVLTYRARLEQQAKQLARAVARAKQAEADLRRARHEMASLAMASSFPTPVIISAVAEHFGVDAADITSMRRNVPIVLPRHVAMYLCRKLTKASLPQIGRRFNRDHTTVLYAVQKVERMIEADDKFAVGIEALTGAIRKRITANPPRSDSGDNPTNAVA